MTEGEAKTKWCPQARVTSKNGTGGGNRWDKSGGGSDAPHGSLCIGSNCMSWRWSVDNMGEPLYRSEVMEGSPTTLNSPEGYCGLAGKP